MTDDEGTDGRTATLSSINTHTRTHISDIWPEKRGLHPFLDIAVSLC